MVNRGGARHGTDVEQHTDIGFQDRAERVEEPAVTDRADTN